MEEDARFSTTLYTMVGLALLITPSPERKEFRGHQLFIVLSEYSKHY